MRLDRTKSHIESLVTFKDTSSCLGLWNQFGSGTSTSVQLSGDRSKSPALTAVQVRADSSVILQTHEIVKSSDRVIGSCVANSGDRSTLLILLDSGAIHSFVRSKLTGTTQQQQQKPSVFSFFKTLSRSSSRLHRVGPPTNFESYTLLTSSDPARDASNYSLGLDFCRFNTSKMWRTLYSANSDTFTSPHNGRLDFRIFQTGLNEMTITALRIHVGSSSSSSSNMPETIHVMHRLAHTISRGTKSRWYDVQLSLAEQKHVFMTGVLDLHLTKSHVLGTSKIVIRALELYGVSQDSLRETLERHAFEEEKTFEL